MRAADMRVLHLSDFFPPVSGGLERVVHDLTLGLAGKGVRTSVATLTPEPVAGPGVDVHRLRSSLSWVPGAHADRTRPFHPPAPDPLVTAQLARLVSRLRPDVIHAHSWMVNSWLPLRRVFPAVRTIVYAHDYGIFCPKKTNRREGETVDCNRPGVARCSRCAADQYPFGKSAVLALSTAAMRASAVHASDLFAVSGQVAAVLGATLMIDHPQVIPPAVRLTAAPPVERAEYLPRGPFVLYVGQLSSHKGFDLLCAVAAANPGVEFLALGLPKQEGVPPLPANLSVRIDVPHSEVLSAWQHATVGFIPSRWADPMPLVAIEAATLGCPLVASAAGGLQEAVVDGVTGYLVPPGDQAAADAALKRILSDQDLRESFSSAAVRHSAKFDYNSVVDRWIEVYSSKSGRTADRQ